jgi:hypothetical protein
VPAQRDAHLTRHEVAQARLLLEATDLVVEQRIDAARRGKLQHPLNAAS